MTSANTLVQFEHEMMKERLKAKGTLKIIQEEIGLARFAGKTIHYSNTHQTCGQEL
jgi:hypothetical protein